jgi:hypothetical protein
VFDADLEVVVGGYGPSVKQIFAINPDGSDVMGFPLDLGEKVKIGVALADFNGNGKDDIVVGSDSDNIHLFYDDGTEAPGFPYQVGDKIQSTPSILDVDGQKVIFVGSNDNNLYAINSDGSLRFSIPTTNKVFNSPAFLEHNNTFYVFFSDDSGNLYAVDTDGNALSGWPINVDAIIPSSVAFSDLDGDGEAEVVAVTEAGDVRAYNMDGSPNSGFPMVTGLPFFSSPMILDMDEDGELKKGRPVTIGNPLFGLPSILYARTSPASVTATTSASPSPSRSENATELGIIASTLIGQPDKALPSVSTAYRLPLSSLKNT